jgi:hypothetical protein
MILRIVAKVVWRFYQEGRARATQQTYTEKDITSMGKMALSEMIHQNYIRDLRLKQTPDYYMISPILSIQPFELAPIDGGNMRRIDMSKFDLYRLPKDAHVANIYLRGSGCVEDDMVSEVSLVRPSEENFYRNDPDLAEYPFAVVKGRGINIYNAPSCADFADVESTFDSDEIDVSLDFAYQISTQVLGVMLKIPGFMKTNVDNPYENAKSAALKKALQQQEQQPA